MAVLVATLIDYGKALADKRNDASIPDADWLQYTNYAVKDLWRFISSFDPDFSFATNDFTLAGGSSGNTLNLSSLGTTVPANQTFAALHGLDFNPDTPQRRTIPRRNFQERNRGRIGWWFPTLLSVDRAYDIRGRVLTLTPYENVGGNYRIYFRSNPYLFTGTGDTTPLDPQLEAYDEYLTIMMARQALSIEESTTDFKDARLAELRQQIQEEHERDDEAPAVLADVESDTDTSTSGWW